MANASVQFVDGYMDLQPPTAKFRAFFVHPERARLLDASEQAAMDAAFSVPRWAQR